MNLGSNFLSGIVAPFRTRQTLLAAAATAFAVVVAGCSSTAKPSAAPPPAPEVTVAEVVCKSIGDVDEFTGRLEAVNMVEVRPRVSGYLQKVYFKEGAIVKQGDLLFLIDPRPFQAEVDRLKGDLAQAKAEVARAQSDFQRAERLHNNDGMSVEEYDRRASAKSAAEAHIASTEGSLRSAELNLEFTRVIAPISGRIGRAEITEGNLVEGGAAQIRPLTTLVSLDPIYVYFDADEQTYLKYARVSQKGKTGNAHELTNVVYLGLADEEGFPHEGRVNFVSNQVSSTTGTIQVRGTFANKNLALTPGLFARVRLQGSGSYQACLMRDEAVITDLSQKYVYVLGKSNTLDYRPVKLGSMSDGLRVVRDGLRPGDVIVINGLQRVRPGSTVNPKKVAMAVDNPSAGLGSSSAAPNGAQDPKARQ